MGVLTEEEAQGHNNVYIGYAAHKDHLNWSWKFKMWLRRWRKGRLDRHLVKWVSGELGINPKPLKGVHRRSTVFIDKGTIAFSGEFIIY